MLPNPAEQDHHTMLLEQSHPDGMDEFYCPTCGRRLLIQWNPEYKKVVIEPGDEFAIHSGGKGGVRINSIEAHPDNGTTREDEQYLAPWLDWMRRVDFDRLWDEVD